MKGTPTKFVQDMGVVLLPGLQKMQKESLKKNIYQTKYKQNVYIYIYIYIYNPSTRPQTVLQPT